MPPYPTTDDNERNTLDMRGRRAREDKKGEAVCELEHGERGIGDQR